MTGERRCAGSEDRLRRMLEYPDMTGNVLLCGVALAMAEDFRMFAITHLTEMAGLVYTNTFMARDVVRYDMPQGEDRRPARGNGAGKLPEYFPEVNWADLYQRIDALWQRPSWFTSNGDRTLLVGDDDGPFLVGANPEVRP